MIGIERIAHHPQLDEIKLLGGFKHLSTIEVIYRFFGDPFMEPNLRDGDQIMAEVVAVLKKSQEQAAKYTRIRVNEAGHGGHTIWADTVKVSEVWGD